MMGWARRSRRRRSERKSALKEAPATPEMKPLDRWTKGQEVKQQRQPVNGGASQAGVVGGGVEGEMFEDWVELAARSGPWRRRVPL